MAGISEAGPPQTLSKSALSRQQFATITWLRWRIFVNSLRSKGATGELVVKILSVPVLGAIIFGPAVGAAFGAFYCIHAGQDALLAIPLWLIFLLWQFIGASTSATGPSFDLSTLVRFPLRYRDYLLMRLSFGLMDPPTLAGIMCLIGMSIGVAIADPRLLPWAAFCFFLYAVCNVLFSRMVYSWMERWMAQRKTRELVTGAILLGSLLMQFGSQFIQKLAGHHGPTNPLVAKIGRALLAINWFLPPGLAASSVQHMHADSQWMALAAFAGLLLFTCGFLLILHIRLHAQYLGESLSEAPAAVKAKKAASKMRPANTPAAAAASTGSKLLSPAVAASLIKDLRYLLRSGPRLYVLIMPVFVVFLFSARNSGLNYIGMAHGLIKGMLFCYGCAYMQLIFVGFLYNSLGGDGAGVQFYFLAPLRMRDVILAKNLLTGAIMLVELVLIYIVATFIAGFPPADITATTVAWSFFAFFLNTGIGNVRSIVSPKAMDPSKMRGQSVSAVSSLISLAVMLSAIALGGLMLALCAYLRVSFWAAAIVFLALSGLSLGAYLLVLNRIDSIAQEHVEDLTQTLSKAA
jgi:ABC-2 type transport system permease protein